MEGEKRDLKDEQSGKIKKGRGLRQKTNHSAGNRHEIHRSHRWKTPDIDQTARVESK